MSQILQKCDKFENPSCEWSKIPYPAIKTLELVPFRLPSITHFCTRVDSANDFEVIRNKLPLSHLKHLEIYFRIRYPDAEMILLYPILHKTTSLTKLAITNFRGILDLTPLEAMPHLQQLFLPHCGLNDKSCHDLARFAPRIHDLLLMNNQNISIEGIRALSYAMGALNILIITNTKAEGQIADMLTNPKCFPNLRYVLVSKPSPAEQNKLDAIRPNLKFCIV